MGPFYTDTATLFFRRDIVHVMNANVMLLNSLKLVRLVTLKLFLRLTKRAFIIITIICPSVVATRLLNLSLPSPEVAPERQRCQD